MSLLRIVTEKVRQRGRASPDDVLPELRAQGWTREQVITAFQNAQTRRLIRCVGVAEAVTGRRGPGIYVPSDSPEKKVVKKNRHRPPRSRKGAMRVNSVFQLGEVLQ